MFNPKLVCFDLNKTLIHENTWERLNAAMGVTAAEDALLLDWAKEDVINGTIGDDILCNIYKKRGNPTRDNIEVAIRKYSYLSGAKELVTYCLDKKYQIVLISGAMDILVEHVAAELGIAHWRAASQFCFDKNDVLTNIVSAPNDAMHKAEQLRSLADELHIALTDCVAIGDGANDAELFRVTTHGITFSESAIAADAWKVVGSLSEIQTII